MQNTATQCLWEATGHEWEEITAFYLDFRLKATPFKRMCVISPDDSRTLMPRYFIPKNDRDLHNPDQFVEKYFKTSKEKVQLATPAFKYDMDSFPGFTIYTTVATLKKIYLLKCNVKLDGDLLFKSVHHEKNITVSAKSLNKLNLNTSIALNEFIATMKVSVDYENKKCTLGSSIAGEYGSTSFMIESPTSFTISATPQKVSTIFNAWEIEGQLGYDIEANIIDNDDQSPVSLPSYQQIGVNEPSQGAIVDGSALMGALIIIGIGLLAL